MMSISWLLDVYTHENALNFLTLSTGMVQGQLFSKPALLTLWQKASDIFRWFWHSMNTCLRAKTVTCQRTKNESCQRTKNNTCQRTKNVTCQRTRAGQEWQQQSNTGQSTWRHFGAWKDVSIYVLVNKNITKLWNYLNITSFLSHVVGYEFGQWPWGDYGVSDEFSHKVTLYLSLCPHFKVALNDQDEG